MSAALDLLRRLEPHLNALVCYASTTSEYEPNKLVQEVRALLAAPQPDPARTADWKVGDTFEYENDGGEMVWQSGIHTFGHWQSIVCYGKTEAEAVAKRDAILAAVGAAP